MRVLEVPAPQVVRLVVTPEAVARFAARLESTGELLVAGTRQPLVDGARELLARGFEPTAPLTMRHEGSAHDSFQPMPIGQWAKAAYNDARLGAALGRAAYPA
jgi:hypothetical protein